MTAIAVATFLSGSVDVYSQTGKAKKRATTGEQTTSEGVAKQSDATNTVGEGIRRLNAYCSPVDIVLSGFSDIDLGLDYKVAEFMTVGIGYRGKSGTSSGIIAEIPQGTSLRAFRIQADLYTAGTAFKSSFAVQLKHTWNTFTDARDIYTSTYSMNGFGALIGWRWFWTDPGEIGLNVSILGGGSRLTVTEVGGSGAVVEGVVPELRIDLGYVF